jgi:hypothetical protein
MIASVALALAEASSCRNNTDLDGNIIEGGYSGL